MSEDKEATYEEAKEAKEVLIKYLSQRFMLECADLTDGSRHREQLAYLALTQEYFLD